MHTEIERERSHAMVLTADDIAAIVRLLGAAYEGLTIAASCSDGSKLSTADAKELLEYENPRFRRIESLRIRSGEIVEDGCVLMISGRTDSTWGFSISDDDDKRALALANELEKRLNDCKPWYSILTRISPMVAFWAIAFTLLVISTWWRVLATGHFPTASNISYVELIYFVAPLVLAYVLIFSYADRGWRWLFPTVWFCIGRQNREFEKRARVRYWIFGGVGLAIIVSVLANLISHMLTKP